MKTLLRNDTTVKAGVAGVLALAAGTSMAQPKAGNDEPSIKYSTSAVVLRVLENDYPKDGVLRVTKLFQSSEEELTTASWSGGCEQKCQSDSGAVLSIASDGEAIEYFMDREFMPESIEAKVDEFYYQVSDLTSEGFDTARVTVTVVNQRAEAFDDTATVKAGSTQNVIYVRGNDKDLEGHTFSIARIVQAPAHGTATQDDAYVFYTPSAGFAGQDTFTYAIQDYFGESSTATVTVTVVGPDPVDDPVDGEYAVPSRTAGATRPGRSIDVTANDRDFDPATMEVRIARPPLHGTAEKEEGGNAIVYTANDNYTGDDYFLYEIVQNGVASEGKAQVSIRVERDEGSIAESDETEVPENKNVLIDVLANDSDPDFEGDNAGMRIKPGSVTQPKHGTAVIEGSPGQIRYTPNAGYSGPDDFQYVAEDRFGWDSEPATVSVSVVAQARPTIAISNASVTENTDGTASELTFEVSLSVVGELPVTVDYATSDGTATAGADYQATSGTLTIPAGQTTGAITVQVLGDALSEGNETLNVALSNAANAVLGSVPSATGTIIDNDKVILSIDDASAEEADGTMNFNVRLSTASSQAVTVQYTSVDGTATAGSDYTAASGVLTIAPGETAGTISVAMTEDRVNESDETFTLTLSTPTNAELEAAASATGTIKNTGSDWASLEAQLEGLPENLRAAGRATIKTCTALEDADPSGLTQGQQNLLSSCAIIAEEVERNPDQTADALEQISGQQNISRIPTALTFGATQLGNINTRLLDLRQGAAGLSTAGLRLALPESSGSLSALSSLGEVLFGEGGASGDEEPSPVNDRLGFFLNGSVRFGDKDATSRESGFDFETDGVTAGVDYRFSDTVVAGAALGYGKANADFDGNRGSQDAKNYAGSLYGTWYTERGYLDGIVGFGQASYDTVRKINLFDGAVEDRIEGSTDGHQWTLGVSGGYDFVNGGARFGPHLAMDYVRVDVDEFTESDEGSGLSLRFGDQTADSLTLKAGGQFFYSISRTWGVVSPYARFDLITELLDDSSEVSIRFANDPVVVGPGTPGGEFVLFTDNPDEFYLTWAVGLTSQFAAGLSIFVDYEAVEEHDSVSSGLVTLGVRYQKSFR